MGTVRVVVALFLAWLGGLGVVGSALAWLFERDAFGTGSDEPRAPYLALYVVLAVGCAAATLAAWWWLVPRARWWALPVLVASVALSAVMVGALGI